jgi:hypothetical protein
VLFNDLEQLLAGFFSHQSIKYDLAFSLVQNVLLAVFRGQILVELAIQLVTRFLDKDKTTHDNKNLPQGRLLAVRHRIFGQFQQEWLSQAQIAPRSLAQVRT